MIRLKHVIVLAFHFLETKIVTNEINLKIKVIFAIVDAIMSEIFEWLAVKYIHA